MNGKLHSVAVTAYSNIISCRFLLSTALATFQGMCNHIIRDTLNKEMSAIMYDNIKWSEMHKVLHKTTRELLRRPRNNRLYIAPEKYDWVQHQIEFQGSMVSGQGFEMINEKVCTLEGIKLVKTPNDVQYFSGFANFYRRFITDYSKIILPITNRLSLEQNEW